MTQAPSQQMRAVVVDGGVAGKLALRQVAAPQPGPSQALVRVAAISLNRGETRNALNGAADGWRPGWDLAGTVERAAADGTGPRAGARVVGMLPMGAWAEFAAVPTAALATLPDGVSIAQAATLPVAGLTALHALAKGGSLLGRPVLIGGATGGVGSFALQLARLSGAHVVAAIRDAKDEALVRRLGADAVAIGPHAGAAAGQGPFDLILESVGGPSLAAALGMLTSGGTCVLFGASLSGETTFDAGQFYRGGGTRLYGLFLGQEFQAEPASIGLARLARLIADGKLQPEIAIEAPWTEIADVAAQLMARRFTGKAVLHL
ncbi:zinc-binding dehydrogenase [Reyranella sp. CPCC 100927]|uniref:zinc-binding dehydrogenase n=1 Tax=Reyranella sp. CPCC 100927 TaxID=2599616 RepID=UPI001C4995DF|nr:zinc-binding dehydrogenase [Reyranella sp. CPCC 100927]